MDYTILDEHRKDILPHLGFLKAQDFYLAGGTALALYYGHRDSIDFDFFKIDEFDTTKLRKDIERNLDGNYSVTVIMQDVDTLTVLVDQNIQLSFYHYPYPLLQETFDEPFLQVASPLDIGCMKFSAILGRSTNKDYIDLYYLLQNYSLEDLLQASVRKFPTIDPQVILKSLTYYDDVDDEPILFHPEYEVDLSKIKETIELKVSKYQNEIQSTNNLGII